MAILEKSKQLKKELSLFNLYTIATGATIASGFFILPGLAYAQAGPALILSYLIAAIPVIPALFSMAELSTAMPRAGGIYFFLARSMGPVMGCIGGIGAWMALILKTAFALVGISAYTNLFFPQIPMLPLTAGLAIFFGLVNFFGAKKTGLFQGLLVIGLLILLSWFSGNGIFFIKANYFDGFFDKGINSVFATAGLVYVSFVGLSKIDSVSEEVKNPERNLPLAMFLALGTALIIYLIGTFIIVGVVPGEILKNNLTPVAEAAKFIGGKWSVTLITVSAILAFFSVANAGILSASRYPLAMSRDHLLPRSLRYLTKNRIPKNSILLTVLLIIITLIIFDPTKIAKLAGSFQLLLFALSSLAVIVMRESRIVSYDPGFRSPLYPYMQIFGIISSIWLISEMGWLPAMFTSGIIVVGIAWYFYYAKDIITRKGAIYQLFARLGERSHDGLDTELRSILKEKGLREDDPYDAVVTCARIIEFEDKTDFDKIILNVSDVLSKHLSVDAKLLAKIFMEGTLVGATPVAHGAALPHMRLPKIKHSEMVIVRVKYGVHIDIDIDIADSKIKQEPIFAFFFLVSPEDNPRQHLRILAQIASHVDDERFIKKWLFAKNEQELKELLLRDDRYLSLLLERDSSSAELIDCKIRNLDLPEGSLIVLIHREGEMIIPSGETILEENDRLTIISNPKGIEMLYSLYIN